MHNTTINAFLSPKLNAASTANEFATDSLAIYYGTSFLYRMLATMMSWKLIAKPT